MSSRLTSYLGAVSFFFLSFSATSSSLELSSLLLYFRCFFFFFSLDFFLLASLGLSGLVSDVAPIYLY